MTTVHNTFIRIGCISLLASLAACGGGDGGGAPGMGGGGGDPPVVPGVVTYAVGGAVQGLASGQSIVLRNNGGDDLTLNSNGSFQFQTRMASGASYAVTVASQPNGQSCQVQAGSGQASANVGNISVSCSNTPVVTPGGSAACLEAPQMRVQGNSWKIYNGSNYEKQTVVAPGSFNGHANADHVRAENSMGQVVDLYSNVRDRVAYSWGGVMSVPVAYEFQFNPGLAMPLDLPLNQPYRQTYENVSIQSGGPARASLTQSTTYRGRETVVTAFGSFETCKIEFSNLDASGATLATWTNWYFADPKYSGLVAQRYSAQEGQSQPSKIEVSWP